MSQAVKQMEEAGLDASLILFQMWTEAMKHVAEFGRGNVMFLDGSPAGMEKTLQQMGAMQTIQRRAEMTQTREPIRDPNGPRTQR
jgi:hypothetical protein